MPYMCLLDQLIIGTDHVIVYFKHGGDIVKIMIKAGIVLLFDLLDGVLETEGNELIQFLSLFFIEGSLLFDVRDGVENCI